MRYKINEFELDATRFELTKNGKVQHVEPQVFDLLIQSGAVPMGHFAVNGCRMEKGFRHWGHDIGPTVTPIEAGLGFTIDWSKDFLGKDRLREQKDGGVTQRVVLMQILGDALMLHDEPIYEQGVHVGFTTSGAVGPRTGLSLSMACL